jgi:hypothetical protein
MLELDQLACHVTHRALLRELQFRQWIAANIARIDDALIETDTYC